MSKLEIIDVVADILFIFFLILNSVYVKALEKELNALKSWIEVFWKIDFGKMSEAVAKEKLEADRPQGEWIDAEIPLESDGSMPIQVCNLCKTFYPLAYTGGGHRFCPNCGARMKGADDEADRNKK